MRIAPPVAILCGMYVEHLRVSIGPGELHVERMGRGAAAVLLLHGFGTNASLWRPTGARLAGAGYLVLAPDLLGHGESDRPIEASYDLGSQADVLATALTAMRVPRATVIGQDVGGLVALAFAARHPTRAVSVALLNPPDLSDLPPAPVRAMQRVAGRLPLSASGSRLGAAALLSALLEQGDEGTTALSLEAEARYLAPWVGTGGVEQLRLLARVLETDSVPLDGLAAIETETLVVRSDRDRTVPVAVSRDLVRALPNARLHTLHDHGRLLPEEAPEQLAALLLEFMQTSTNPDVGA
jgi:pimeloyl-ACP methyl ester carboxylesterase